MLSHCKLSLRTLRNILLCNWYRVTGRLKYPYQIIPKLSFKKSIDIDTLLKGRRVFLIRRSTKSFEDTFYALNDQYFMREDAFDHKDVRGLSLNILGGKFKQIHLNFRIILDSIGGRKWDGATAIYLSNYLDSIQILEKGFPIFFDANNLHDQTIYYEREKNKDLTMEVQKFIAQMKSNKIIEKTEKYELPATTKLIHDPINLNYWHIELNIFDYRNILVDRQKKASTWIESVCDQARKDILAANAFHKLPNLNSIPKGVYKKIA